MSLQSRRNMAQEMKQVSHCDSVSFDVNSNIMTQFTKYFRGRLLRNVVS
jgi:hypothetical protein